MCGEQQSTEGGHPRCLEGLQGVEGGGSYQEIFMEVS